MASSVRVDTALVEELLYGSEGVDLDFKRDQYPFVGANDLEKAELLKDILAFANAFRRSDAFILIGVDELPGSRATVFGVSNHLQDADLQQFVNTKTNRNVVFSYHAVEVEGKQVGVICIQDQQRPIYLKKDFGGDPDRSRPRLAANAVYFRVGSSTKEASPDDVALMVSHLVRQPLFSVDLQFADLRHKTLAGALLTTTHEFFLYEGKVPGYTRVPRDWPPGLPYLIPSYPCENGEFWREAYDYVEHWRTLVPVGFCIENRGSTTIDDVTVELSFANDDKFVLVSENDMPTKPETTQDFLFFSRKALPLHDPDLQVEKRGEQQVVTLRFGKIQAGQRQFLSTALYVGNPLEKHVIVDALVRADQFTSPLISRLEFHTLGTVKKVEWNEVQEIIEKHVFEADPDSGGDGDETDEE